MKCSSRSEQAYPNVTFTIGGRSFTLSVLQYFYIVNDGQDFICNSVFGVSPLNNVWVLGDYFLSRFYSVYDIGQNRVGFATSISYSYTQSIDPDTFTSKSATRRSTFSIINLYNRYVYHLI